MRTRPALPLWGKVLAGVVLGIAVGTLLGKESPFSPPAGAADWLKNLGDLGMLVIKMLRALAVPLVFFAILDAFVKTRIPARAFGRLIAICLVNVTVAMTIGLTLLNTLHPGRYWQGNLAALTAEVKAKAPEAKKVEDPEAPGATLELLPNVSYYVPSSLVRPFIYNNLISVVLLAVLGGAALRKVRERGDIAVASVEGLIEGLYHILLQVLEWVVQTVPLAVFCIVAKVVGASGVGVFRYLWIFLAVALAGLALHSLVYYPLMAWLVGRKSPRVYLGRGADAILTGLSTNSSLATVPVTLRCLEKMGVSPGSARLAACVGTNLNNDGITLYEAMAALFLTQALGAELSLTQQLTVVGASIMAGAGVAGIPEAGFIVLPLVLSAAGLSPELVLVALPLLMPVDWIIARARSGVNVMSDMLVAVLLDAAPARADTAD